MEKNAFWTLIEEARSVAEDSRNIAGHLAERLLSYSPEQILRWHGILDCYHSLSRKNKLWAAAYVINGGCSDDGFEYFRGWLIAQGKETFLRALQDPDSLAGVDVEADEAEDEEILSAGMTAYFQRMGPQEPDYDAFDAAFAPYALSETDIAQLQADLRYAPDIDIVWDEASLETVLPKLTARFY
ncbi:DUF4240 domain-containing protein [Stenotrophomonas maltophilia]|uniref:DUF4240 domain-containing protein n=1 Tax=Stenotrophomonas maltophilia TaxID=40324 RepID=UPI0013D98645|nr:DUF4240 domain-containing protein [Stenotrophomonas maltophilia]EKT4087096.1 DUF4240 domain-containing protein [Stenotrophomonas maltophilia]